MATWEAQFSASFFILLNGGTGGAVWMYIGTFLGFFGQSTDARDRRYRADFQYSCNSFDGGDGVYGANDGWPIPLGQRICTQKCAA